MKNCPDPIIWQSMLDGEEAGEEYEQHLRHCEQCRRVYQDIEDAISLAGGLSTGAGLPEGFARRLAAETRAFPAGLMAASLFVLLVISVLMFDPFVFHRWLTVGLTAQCGLVIDIMLTFLKAAQRINPAWWLTLAAAVVALEVLLLTKLKTAESSGVMSKD